MQDLALGLVELHEVGMGPPLQHAQVPLDGISSLYHVSCDTQLGVICKLADSALNPSGWKDYSCFYLTMLFFKAFTTLP